MTLIFFNRSFEKNRLKALILWNLSQTKEKNTIDLLEKIKKIGFSFATYAGVSLSIDDLKIPPTKAELLVESQKALNISKKEYEKGNITGVENFQQIIDLWYRTSENLKQNVIQHFKATDLLNPVYMMAFSGARGNISQVRQLVGMRGLMADPQGQILEFPIRSNFREGLTLTEYIISCYGARKGLVDTALRTANAGYLTRRLVDVAQHIIVRETDCETKTGIYLTDMKGDNKKKVNLQKRLVGRVLGEDLETIAKKNQDISPVLALKIVEKISQVCVRSPLTCKTKNPICQFCYGWSLAYGKLVSKGEAVGVLAAQSIGEPGTQLTMRTFHTGGVFSGDVIEEIKAPIDGVINYENPLQGTLIRTLYGKIAFLTKKKGNFFISNHRKNIKFSIPISTILFVRQKETIYKKQLLAEYSSTFTKKTKGIKEKYNLKSNFEGQVYFENVLLLTTFGKKGDMTKRALRLGSIWVVSGNIYQSILPSKFFIKNNDLVNTNSILDQSILLSPYDGFLKPNNLKEKTIYNFKKDLNNNLNKIETLIHFFTKNIQKNQNLQQTKIQDFFLSSPFMFLSIKNINYKKFGYFLSLYNLVTYKFLLSISLKNKTKNSKKITFQFFQKKKTNEFICFEKQNITNFILDGQLFSLPEKKFGLKNFLKINFFLESKRNLVLRNKTFWLIIQTTKQKKKINLFEYFFYEKNINLKKKKNEKYHEIKKKNFLKNQIQKNYLKKKKLTYKKKNNHYLVKLKIKPGWLYLEKNTIIFACLKNQKLIIPGQLLAKKIFLDQHFIFREHIPFTKIFVFFKHQKNLIKTRVLKNQKFKMKKSNIFFKNKKNISKNFIYKKNFFYKKRILSLFKKGIETTNFSIFLNKPFFYNKIKNLYFFKPFDIKSNFLNKQSRVKMKLNHPSINIKKNFLIKKNLLCNFNLVFNAFQKSTLQESKTEYTIGLFLIIFLVQRINFLNYTFKKQEKKEYLRKNSTKFYIDKTKQITEKLNTTVNSFFSTYEGEIIKTKIDNLGKQKTLILTNKNQISFPLKKNSTFLTIGQFARYGEKFSDNFGILESGQVFQIDKKKITLRKAQPFLFGSKGIFLINHDDIIETKTPLITLFYQKIKTEDIIQGIPRIEEIFEARQPKEGDILSENLNMKLKFFFYWYSERKKLSFQESAKISRQRIQTIIVNRIQKIYQSQGVDIADKHIEIIVRQMTAKVKIIIGGGFLRGELISLRKVERKNRKIKYTQQLNNILKEYLKLQKIYCPPIKKIIYEPILLGITKAALEPETESFLSAASFQETTKILSQAALQKKLDFLVGLKENVILGRLIPAGTGLYPKQEKKAKIMKKLNL